MVAKSRIQLSDFTLTFTFKMKGILDTDVNMGRTLPEDDGRDEKDASQRTPKIASKQSEVRFQKPMKKNFDTKYLGIERQIPSINTPVDSSSKTEFDSEILQFFQPYILFNGLEDFSQFVNSPIEVFLKLTGFILNLGFELPFHFSLLSVTLPLGIKLSLCFLFHRQNIKPFQIFLLINGLLKFATEASLYSHFICPYFSPGGTVVKNSPANAGEERDFEFNP
ncbi:hypothetical protein MG293_000721 [Ovis ammon polii]|uniref:Uncharacterized protein n=1 Tax=Ovis ammon polii TaxID=230172 RepID=A0AAD4ULS4_OVIAM|nr:hypothetical protein MG293_000721 [Ovis ammon polii]